jgi:hypothetical protein
MRDLFLTLALVVAVFVMHFAGIHIGDKRGYARCLGEQRDAIAAAGENGCPPCMVECCVYQNTIREGMVADEGDEE